MKVAKIMLVAAVLAMGASAAMAGPKIMATAPAQSNYPVFSGTGMKCNILNMNTSAKEVSIEAVDYGGAVTDLSGPLVLAPQTAASLTVTNGFAAYCRFTVDGSPKKYRAVAVYDDGTVYTTSQVAK